jgi:hypothetical protein
MTDDLIDKIIAATAADMGDTIDETYLSDGRELVRSIIKNYRAYVKFTVVEVYDFGDTLSESVWRKRQIESSTKT